MNKKIGAKRISLIGIIISVLIAMFYNLFSLIELRRIPTPEEQKSILLFAFFIIAAFSPVYFSIYLDKILGAKK
jgi:hypothetical protein